MPTNVIDAWAESPYGRYERRVVPALSTPFSDAVTSPIADAPAGRVVDLACGTGATARALRARFPDREIVALDHDRRAPRFARSLSPDAAHWLAGSADAIPLRSGAVAAVVCQQGAQFFSNLAGASAELCRILQPEGVLVVLSWARDGVPLFSLLDDALMRAGATSAPQHHRPASFDVDLWLRVSREHRLPTESLERISAPLQVQDARRLVEHFIEATDAAHATAIEHAVAALEAELARGSTLTAVRAVHRATTTPTSRTA